MRRPSGIDQTCFVAFSTATDCMWRRVVQATRRCAFWTTVPKGYQYNWNMLPVGQQLWWHPAMTPAERHTPLVSLKD
ncbi:MAG: hypothetical protein WBV43_09985 [Pseudolabrys sp.]|jgi:hypothetical protein